MLNFGISISQILPRLFFISNFEDVRSERVRKDFENGNGDLVLNSVAPSRRGRKFPPDPIFRDTLSFEHVFHVLHSTVEFRSRPVFSSP